MSVLYPSDRTEFWAPKNLDCFYCGKQIGGLAVFWKSQETLVLHPDCASQLAVHLIADSREAQLAAVPHFINRARRIVEYHAERRHKLLTAEGVNNE
ncbi:MAG: hypothetical protein EPO21_14860 [Chloroflexota bacterium]|nr:MAG: hypothetical protein EPO21_14860 [Chloroflexota bacterium]